MTQTRALENTASARSAAAVAPVREQQHRQKQRQQGEHPIGHGKAVEAPLLEVVMAKADHNQSRAAQWLGLNRNTLRKKLLEHGLID